VLHDEGVEVDINHTREGIGHGLRGRPNANKGTESGRNAGMHTVENKNLVVTITQNQSEVACVECNFIITI
jgi:hypothetical protein